MTNKKFESVLFSSILFINDDGTNSSIFLYTTK
jgi:hypothetical protein